MPSTEHRSRTKSILGFPGATPIHIAGDALELDCDVLVPAALETSIDGQRRGQHQGADCSRRRKRPHNSPPRMRSSESKGKLVIPDIYANAGGVRSPISSG